MQKKRNVAYVERELISTSMIFTDCTQSQVEHEGDCYDKMGAGQRCQISVQCLSRSTCIDGICKCPANMIIKSGSCYPSKFILADKLQRGLQVVPFAIDFYFRPHVLQSISVHLHEIRTLFDNLFCSQSAQYYNAKADILQKRYCRWIRVPVVNSVVEDLIARMGNAFALQEQKLLTDNALHQLQVFFLKHYFYRTFFYRQHDTLEAISFG